MRLPRALFLRTWPVNSVPCLFICIWQHLSTESISSSRAGSLPGQSGGTALSPHEGAREPASRWYAGQTQYVPFSFANPMSISSFRVYRFAAPEPITCLKIGSSSCQYVIAGVPVEDFMRVSQRVMKLMREQKSSCGMLLRTSRITLRTPMVLPFTSRCTGFGAFFFAARCLAIGSEVRLPRPALLQKSATGISISCRSDASLSTTCFFWADALLWFRSFSRCFKNSCASNSDASEQVLSESSQLFAESSELVSSLLSAAAHASYSSSSRLTFCRSSRCTTAPSTGALAAAFDCNMEPYTCTPWVLSSTAALSLSASGLLKSSCGVAVLASFARRRLWSSRTSMS
mmetsp:Transcript_128501/g.363684  ORF Transcript_128501/g.363684 Transcript_128501/m.363684 type:complete len:345 (+) Transcript_128501:116-1150(+)